MARKTYKSKRAALRAARGKEVYRVKGPPRGWRISRGAKVRGKRGRAMKRRKRLKAKRRKVKKRKSKKRKRKPISKITIKMGNPNPYVCGYE